MDVDMTVTVCAAPDVTTSLTVSSARGLGNVLTWSKSFDPNTESTYRVDVTCRKTDGTVETITATSVHPTSASGLKVPSCDLAFAGSHGESLTVNGAKDGAAPGFLSSFTAPSTSTLYPNCVGGGNACTYVVEHLGVPCVEGDLACADWGRHALAAPGDWSCMFGEYPVPIGACSVDERVYEQGGTTLTELNTDGNPWTYSDPAPSWAPKTAPQGSPGGAPAPVTGTQTPTTTTQVNNEDCWPAGAAAWNPADWVLTPVKCALTWAFVPRAATMTSLAGAATADLNAAGIAPLGAAVGANFDKLGGGSGCAGPAVTFSAVGVVEDLHPFSACAEPISTLAGISRAVTTVVVICGGGFVLMRAIGAGFGFNFSMGRGSSDH